MGAGIHGRKLRLVAVFLVLALVAVATSAYLNESRRPGDLVLADGVIEGLTLMGRAAFVSPDGPTPYSNALEDNMLAIELYLASDTRTRFPELTALVERSWTAYLVADELWRLAEAGVTQPLVSGVYAGDELVSSLPSLESVTVGEGEARRFDNTDMKAVGALFAAAAADTEDVRRLVVDLHEGQ